MRQQFLVDTAETFQTFVYENNRKIVPTSATLTVYRPGGDIKLVDGASMTVGGDGLLSYSLTAADNDTADMNYKAVLSYVYNSNTYTFTLFYDVVNTRLVKVITDEDIVNELPQLKDNGYRVHGTAESGSTTTIVDSELKRYDDDYFTGGLAYSIDKDETREITDFVNSTGTVTTAAFSSAISTDRYVITRSYTSEIQRAFEKIEEMLIRIGKRPHLILDPYDLREVHIYFSVAEVCKGLMTENETLWWELWKEYETKAEETFGGINFKYDVSGDGYIARSEESARMNIVKAVRR
jgi:hypothetical protein